MAEKEAQVVTKDEKQLKKEQKEREKREKKLEKERKKQEEKERKKAAKAAKEQKKKADVTSEQPPEKNIEERTQNGVSTSANGGPDPLKDNSAATEALVVASDEAAVREPPVASQSKPEEVTVTEPPGQISGCGQPIGIVFDATRAGKGPLTASCTGAKIGNVQTTVTEVREGIFSVKFTPDVADMYVLSVRWGGKEVNGSPFNINLDRLPPAAQETEKDIEVAPETEKDIEAEAAKETEKGIEAEAAKEMQQEGQGGKEEEEEEVSDDPFEMAIQASRLLEQQRQVQHTTTPLEPSKSTTTTSSHDVSHQQKQPDLPPSHSPNLSPHQPMANMMGEQRIQNTSSLPYPADPSLSPMPSPVISPAREEDVRYLQEVNQSLQQTNKGLGEEVEDLKKKMGEFEAKLSNIEETTRQVEEEKKELIAHINIRGWLYKRGIKGPTANVWRQRYFRCDQGTKVYYYKSADDATPKGYIDLEKVESVDEVTEPEADYADRFGFQVVCTGRTFQLQADDDNTRKRWMSTIEYLKNWHQKNSSVLK